jgi:hypothetical protein
MLETAITEIFDDVMRHPDSGRGLCVDETCRQLTDHIKKRYPPSEYAQQLLEAQEYYMEQFLFTASAVPGFFNEVRAAFRRYQ